MAACSAAAAGTGIITQVLSAVDTVGCTYVQTAYQGLSQSLTSGGATGVAGLLLTLYVMVWGYGIWAGTASGGPTEHAWRLLRVFVIYALATGWADFQIYVYSLLNDGPSAIGASLLAASSANNTGNVQNLSTVSGVETALQSVWDTSVQSAIGIIQSFSVLNPGGYILAGLLLIIMAIFIGEGAFLIVLSKIFMWLLLSLAPVFILMLLFGITTRFFSGWLSSLAQYFIVQVLVYAFLAFYIGISQQAVNALTQTNFTNMTMQTIAPILIVGIIGILLLSQIPHVAASIAGGFALQSPGFGRFLVNGMSAGQAIMNKVPVRGAPGVNRGMKNQALLQARSGTLASVYRDSAANQRLAMQLKNSGG